MSTQRTIKVFIASPGDLAVERRAFKDVIDELNQGYGRGAHVAFEPLGWEDALATVGPRSQSVINRDIDACDIFVLVMARRWGQEAPDAAPYTSYTEEEFYRALDRFQKQKKPAIFVFFKYIDPEQMADAGPQLAKVLDFRKKLERTRSVLYRCFDDEKSFRGEIDKHLTGFVEGKCEVADGDRAVPIIPDSIQAELEKHREEAKRALAELEHLRGEAERATREAEQARAEAKDAVAKADAAKRVAESTAAALSLKLAEDATKAALDGRIEEARQGFAKALDGTTNTRVLYLGYEFFKRIGELAEAERLLRHWLAISGPDTETRSTAAAYGNLGLILQTRGDIDGAETVHRKSLEISEKLGWVEGIATGYGNLGLVLRTRGNLDEAEEMHRKALEIFDKLGQLEGMAAQYGNLGTLLQIRDDLDGAEEMHRKALEIFDKLGQLEGMATQYGNLGGLLQIRCDLDGAEALHRKALVIDQKLGRQEGMARHYSNLGAILQMRASLDGAEEMYRKAFEINERLGRLQGMALLYFNLGMVEEARGDLKEARELWSKSGELYARIGARLELERVKTSIEGCS
jgi:tetratricopeptide (TPR) repeat protein